MAWLEAVAVMETPLFPDRTTRKLKRIRQRGFATIRTFHDDIYVAWRLDRPANTWDTGTEEERWSVLEEGTGKLYANGGSSDQSDGEVIFLLSPYRFRTLATTTIAAGDRLVINGTRVFLVDDVKREDIDDRLADVYLQERATDEIPTEPELPEGVEP